MTLRLSGETLSLIEVIPKGLGNCSARGRRRARPRPRPSQGRTTIAAENGATPHQLMAIFGWKTLAQAESYTEKLRRQLLAGGATNLISFEAGDRERY